MPFSFRLFGLAAVPDKLPPDALRALMLHARHVDPENAEFGNTLLSEAGEYLSGHSLRSLIRDELPYDVAKAEIRENKKVFQRLAALLPAISELFDPENPDNIAGFTSAVWECCGEYRTSLSSERKDKKERQALKRMADASAILRKAVDTVREAQSLGFVSISYGHNHELIFDRETAYLPGLEKYKKFKSTGQHTRSLEQLLREMDLCRATFDIARAEATRDPDGLLLGGSNSKTSVVHNAFDISLMWKGPKISTSPGSDFSHLCAMLFECASGKKDESLAGAINRYARSQNRHKLEEAERQFQEEDTLSDNFDEQRNAINRGRETISECESLLTAPELDDLARHVLTEKIELAKHEIERGETSYGPNQVYLSEMTPAQVEELGVDKLDPRAFWKADIAIGNLRRAMKARPK